MRFGDVTIQRGVPCVMRDGVTLYADIYEPDEAGTYPILLMRQPYGRAIASTVAHAHPVWYANKGYIVVIQDVRGRGDSEGEFNPFVQETKDGYDTVEWAAALPGSNGKVGMYGFSYQGITQWAAVSEHPPALTAIAPSMCPADLYHGTFYPHGSFALGDKLPWAFQLARDTARRAGDNEAVAYCSNVMRNPEALLNHLPILDKHPILDSYFPTYYEWIGHTEYDKYWEERNWLPQVLDSTIPALHIGGWYDSYLAGTLQSYEAMQEVPRTKECFHRLVIGPWTHIPWGRMAGGIDHGPDADGGIHMEQLRWFNHWLKGQEDEALFEEQPVRYYERESKEWKVTNRYPGELSNVKRRRLYLSGSEIPSNGSLGGGRLLMEEAGICEDAAPDVYVFDARLPMRSDGYLPSDRSQQQDRYEILIYSSDTFATSMHIFGSPQVSIRYQTLGGPTDMVATLTCVAPDGKARMLSVGRIDICSEEGQEDNVWHEARIVMRPCATEIPMGFSVRLELTGSAFPLFVRHPNVGEPLAKHHTNEIDLRVATVAVQSLQGSISYIDIPIT